jgi:hypothetical protein
LPLPENTAVCTSVEITGCFMPDPGPRPSLVFRFMHQDGTAMPPIALVLDETQAARLPAGVHEETVRAIHAARNVRRLS